MTAGSPGDELATLLHLITPVGTSAAPLAALPWAPAGAGAGTLVRQAILRTGTAARAHLQVAGSRRRMRVLRPSRGALRAGVRDRLRRRTGSGYVAWLAGPDRETVLDMVLREARSTMSSPLALGADGAVRLRVRRSGEAGLLRMGLVGTPADPAHALAGLQVLAPLSVPVVPRALDSGLCDGVGWLLEEIRPGHRPGVLSAGHVERVAAFTAALPQGDAELSVLDDAALVAAAAPAAVTPLVLRIGADVVASTLADRSQLLHGDLWSGNLLVTGDLLTGVVDWDAWKPAGIPGVDLLHLVATEERIRTRSSLGDVWLRRPWDAPAFVGLLRTHWPDWGGDGDSRAVVGWAWWLGQLAADLRRNPALGRDSSWVARNITAVAVTATPKGHG